MIARKNLNLLPALSLAACVLMLAGGARSEDDEGADDGGAAAKTEKPNAGDAAKTGEDGGDGNGAGRRRAARNRQAGGRKAPDVANEHYGAHQAQVFDLWLAKSDKPTPLVVFIHGGGFRAGSKNAVPNLIVPCLDAGISFASIEYRLTGIGPYPMQHHDVARAIQHLRANAAKWNLDKTRIAATGGSAGAGLSLWLGFHDDLADPKAEDPVARESTRISCALPTNAQCTYDPKLIKEIVPGKAYDHPALKSLYAVAPEFDWDKDPIPEEVAKRIADCGPLSLLTKDDCPVYIQNSNGAAADGNIHHPNFGKHLKKEMDKIGVECVQRRTGDYPVDGFQSPNDEMLAFIKKHFKMEK